MLISAFHDWVIFPFKSHLTFVNLFHHFLTRVRILIHCLMLVNVILQPLSFGTMFFFRIFLILLMFFRVSLYCSCFFLSVIGHEILFPSCTTLSTRLGLLRPYVCGTSRCYHIRETNSHQRFKRFLHGGPIKFTSVPPSTPDHHKFKCVLVHIRACITSVLDFVHMHALHQN
jgi:hypothetical protein